MELRAGRRHAVLKRHEARLGRERLPLHGWLQRQYQTGDAALQAVLDNPFQDYLEVRLPAGVDPNRERSRSTLLQRPRRGRLAEGRCRRSIRPG